MDLLVFAKNMYVIFFIIIAIVIEVEPLSTYTRLMTILGGNGYIVATS